MYYTYKNIKYLHQQATIKTKDTSWIDKLFKHEQVEVVDIDYKQVKLVRTITQNLKTEDITDPISLEQLIVVEKRIEHYLQGLGELKEHYSQFKIPKRTHGYRTITAPDLELKTKQRMIANMLTGYLGMLSHDSAWAYVPGRDIVNAMKQHTNNQSRWYLKLDLHDFFGSCNPEFIKNQLIKLYPFAMYKDTAVVNNLIDGLIKLAKYDEGLPQGTPLSPILTNLIMIEYDYLINKLFNQSIEDNKLFKQRYIYTRYADDIIISAKDSFDYKELVKAIQKLFKDTPLKINKEKTRYGSTAGRNWNLGVMCNKDNNITVGHRKKQQIKAMIHTYVQDYNKTTWEITDLQYVLGQLAWLENVEPEYYKGLEKYFITKYNKDIKQDIINNIKTYYD